MWWAPLSASSSRLSNTTRRAAFSPFSRQGKLRLSKAASSAWGTPRHLHLHASGRRTVPHPGTYRPAHLPAVGLVGDEH